MKMDTINGIISYGIQISPLIFKFFLPIRLNWVTMLYSNPRTTLPVSKELTIHNKVIAN